MQPAAAPGIRGPRGAVPAALGRHRAWPLVEEGREGERPRRRARPPHRTAAPRSAAYHCGRAVGCARHRGEREEDKGGEERGDPDRGLISSNLEVLFAKCLGPGGSTPSISRSDGREEGVRHGSTRARFGPMAGSGFVY